MSAKALPHRHSDSSASTASLPLENKANSRNRSAAAAPGRRQFGIECMHGFAFLDIDEVSGRLALSLGVVRNVGATWASW